MPRSKIITFQKVQLALFLIFVLMTNSCSSSVTPAIDPGDQNVTSDSPGAPFTDSLISSPLLSTGQSLRFEAISLEQGLSQSTVFSMLQDSQGFMWFGTESGLNKYDGYTMTVYKHDPRDPNSLAGHWITAIIEDDEGTLWIGSRDGGLNRFHRDLDQFTHYQNDPQDPASLVDDEITAMIQDQDGMIWLGTAGAGLDRFDPKNEQFTHYQNNPDDQNSLSSDAVAVIYEDSEGMLWIGTENGGLNRLNSETETWCVSVLTPRLPIA